jgi:hypothetical protein
MVSAGGKAYEDDIAWEPVVATSGGFTPLVHRRFDFRQWLTPDPLVQLAASRSYVSSLPDAARERVLADIRELVRTHTDLAGREQIDFPYLTDVLWCRRV